MALPPITSPAANLPPPQAGTLSPRTAAQRAFFQAALGQVQATQAAPAPIPAPSQTAASSAPAEPTGRYRPGSLIDMKV